MDVLTNKHGLAPVYPTQPLQEFDINKLSYNLTLELERLSQLFTVDAQKLKEVSRKFEQELQDGKATTLRMLDYALLTEVGLDKYGSNIVCIVPILDLRLS